MRELVANARSAIGFIKVGTSAGSGFLVRGTNHFITCHHVVKGANPANIVVAFEDKQLHPEHMLQYDQYDLAILLLPPDELPEGGLKLGEFAEVEPGDDLLVLGFPAGEPILTAIRGFASAKAKVRFQGENVPIDVVKLDAAIARGVSGSPCIHVHSEKVIGVVSIQVPARAVLSDAVKSIRDLRKRASNLQNEAQEAIQVLSQRSNWIFISGIDPLQAIAAVLNGIAEVAKDLQAFSQAMEEFAEGIPLGLGYAISIEHYRQVARSITV